MTTLPLVTDALARFVTQTDSSTISQPGTYCPVSVVLKDGTRYTYTATIAKGHPENPMSEFEVLDKFRSNTKESLAPGRCEALIGAVQRLESMDNVREPTDLLNPA